MKDWNHYPVTQAPCDGRFCVAPDRLSHSALGAADNLTETGNILLYGFTNKKAETLIPLARSWNHPPEIATSNGGISHGYDKSQRAYIIAAKSKEVEFRLNGSDKSPIHNPCFVIKGWDGGASVFIDGKMVSKNKNVRQGLVRDTNGKLNLIIWLMIEKNIPSEFRFRKSK